MNFEFTSSSWSKWTVNIREIDDNFHKKIKKVRTFVFRKDVRMGNLLTPISAVGTLPLIFPPITSQNDINIVIELCEKQPIVLQKWYVYFRINKIHISTGVYTREAAKYADCIKNILLTHIHTHDLSNFPTLALISSFVGSHVQYYRIISSAVVNYQPVIAAFQNIFTSFLAQIVSSTYWYIGKIISLNLAVNWVSILKR